MDTRATPHRLEYAKKAGMTVLPSSLRDFILGAVR
jgi:hypothetical protein